MEYYDINAAGKEKIRLQLIDLCHDDYMGGRLEILANHVAKVRVEEYANRIDWIWVDGEPFLGCKLDSHQTKSGEVEYISLASDSADHLYRLQCFRDTYFHESLMALQGLELPHVE